MVETLIVLAKEPLPGRVKTRLVPPLTHAEAADVATAALTDTLTAVGSVLARRHLLAFDGDATHWCPPGWRTCPQPDGGLDRRLAAAFLSVGDGPALLVGMDTPQLRAEHLTAFDPRRYDACLGLASDGGYWAIGLRDPRVAARAIPGVEMSTSRTGADQLDRLRALGLRVQLLDHLSDVDTIQDAIEVGALVPDSVFGRTVASLTKPVLENAS